MVILEDIGTISKSELNSDSTKKDILDFFGTSPLSEARPKKNIEILRFHDGDVTLYKGKLYSITKYNRWYPEFNFSSLRVDDTYEMFTKSLDESNIKWKKDDILSEIDGQYVIQIGRKHIIVFDMEEDKLYSFTELF